MTQRDDGNFKFSLKSLLTSVTLIAVCLGIWVWKTRPVNHCKPTTTIRRVSEDQYRDRIGNEWNTLEERWITSTPTPRATLTSKQNDGFANPTSQSDTHGSNATASSVETDNQSSMVK